MQPDVIPAVVLAIAGVPVAWANTVLHVLALTVAVATATALVVAASRLPGHPARFHTGRPRRTSG